MVHGLAILAVGAFALSAAALCPPSKDSSEKTKVQLTGDTSGKPGCAGAKEATSGCTKGAQLTGDTSGKPGCAGAKEAQAGCAKGAQLAGDKCCAKSKAHAVLASLPAMKYRVGEETTCCGKTAEKMASDSGKPMLYVVGEETFEKRPDAIVKLTAVVEQKVSEMQTIQFSVSGQCYQCPMHAQAAAQSASAKVMYRVGGVDFESKEHAEKALKLVKEAVGNLHATYKVNGTSYHCDKMAGQAASTAGEKMVIVVGDKETCCNVEAAMFLAEAKMRTVVETATQAL
jgi:hypothetical protein